MAGAIANRLLHEPTLQLKRAAEDEDAYARVHALRELFGLDVDTAPISEDAEVTDSRTGGASASRASRVRLGTRGSALALAQAQYVADALGDAEIVAIKTAATAARLGDKARFVREIERALLDGEVDLGVHSAKDLPAELPDGLQVAGVPAREDPADAYVGEAGSLDEHRGGRPGRAPRACAGAPSFSPRAPTSRSPICAATSTPGSEARATATTTGSCSPPPGCGGSAARTRSHSASHPDEMTPAAGQGALALEARRGDAEAPRPPRRSADEAALVELTAERAAVAELDATCHTPVGVSARLDGETLHARRRSSGSRTAASGSATRIGRPPPTRRRSGASSPAACSRRERAEILDAPRRGDGVSARAGVVYLVGAGPGDPGLVTLRAIELIAPPTSIVHDRLIPAGLLDAARDDAELVDVGKRPGDGSVAGEQLGASEAQRAIEDLLVDARPRRPQRRPAQGRRPVRLRPRRRGGRGAARGRGRVRGRARRHRRASRPRRTPAIPVTHRDDASAVAFVTGHEDPGKAESAIDWDALARFPGTLVVYMGVKRLGEIVAALIAAGPRCRRARGRDRARDPRRASAPSRRRSASSRGGGRDGRAARPGRRRDRPGRRAPRDDRVARAPPAARPPRRRHARPRPGERDRARRSPALGAEVVELPAIRIEPRLDSRRGRGARSTRSTPTRSSA